jgi:acetate kinase
VFTGGIGENDIELREAVLEGLSSLGAEKTHQKKKKKTRAVLCDAIV